MTVILGEMDVARVNPYRSGQGEPPIHIAWFAPHRPPAVTHSGVVGDLKSASFPVDDAHQARIADGVEGWGMTAEEDKLRDRLIFQPQYQSPYARQVATYHTFKRKRMYNLNSPTSIGVFQKALYLCQLLVMLPGQDTNW